MSKPSLLSKLLSFIKSEQPTSPLNREKDFDATMRRMGMVGLFDTIEVIAKAAKSTVGSTTTTPTSLVRVYLNGIINSCALVEEVLNRAEGVTPTEQPSPSGSGESSQEEDRDIDAEGFDWMVDTFTGKGKA